MTQNDTLSVEIEEFPHYTVNDVGEVYHDVGGRRGTYTNNRGHLFVSLRDVEGVFRTRAVCRLVAEVFVANRFEHFNTVVHLDGDHSNCCADNLVWRSRPFAVRYRRQFDRPWLGRASIRDSDTGVWYSTVREAAMALGLMEADIIERIDTDLGVMPINHLFEYV